MLSNLKFYKLRISIEWGPWTESTEQQLCVGVHLQLRHEGEKQIDVGDQHDHVHDELPEEECGEGTLKF